jgi:DNA-directed RNA polymerase specialized sigma24 family protein
MFKVIRGVENLRARGEPGAQQWLNTIIRNAFTDHIRALRGGPSRAGDTDVEGIGAPATSDDEQLIREARYIREGFEERLTLFVEKMPLRPLQRLKALLHARAVALRVLDGAGSAEIRSALDEPDVSEDVINKWVQRGRPVVLKMLDQWQQEADEQQLRIIENLRVQFGKRRSDAGKPRPGRRKSVSDKARKAKKAPKRRADKKAAGRGARRSLRRKSRRSVSLFRFCSSVQDRSEYRTVAPGGGRDAGRYGV